MSNLSDVAKILLVDRNKYSTLTDKDKNDNFFILNRFLSKRFPEQSIKLNLYKTIDKPLALDIWYIFLRGKADKNYNTWLWSSNKVNSVNKDEKTKNLLTKKEYNLFKEHYTVNDIDMNILLNYFSDEIKDEIKYIKNKIKKENE